MPGATGDPAGAEREIKRVVLCTGKVYFDLMEEREKRGENRIQILRVEQLYPFPENVLAQELTRFPKAEMVWCQEEPKNRAPGTSSRPNLEWVLDHIGAKHRRPRLCRPSKPRRRPRPGSMSKHKRELKAVSRRSAVVRRASR